MDLALSCEVNRQAQRNRAIIGIIRTQADSYHGHGNDSNEVISFVANTLGIKDETLRNKLFQSYILLSLITAAGVVPCGGRKNLTALIFSADYILLLVL